MVIGEALYFRCRQQLNLSHLNQACFIGINRHGMATSIILGFDWLCALTIVFSIGIRLPIRLLDNIKAPAAIR